MYKVFLCLLPTYICYSNEMILVLMEVCNRTRRESSISAVVVILVLMEVCNRERSCSNHGAMVVILVFNGNLFVLY